MKGCSLPLGRHRHRHRRRQGRRSAGGEGRRDIADGGRHGTFATRKPSFRQAASGDTSSRRFVAEDGMRRHGAMVGDPRRRRSMRRTGCGRRIVRMPGRFVGECRPSNESVDRHGDGAGGGHMGRSLRDPPRRSWTTRPLRHMSIGRVGIDGGRRRRVPSFCRFPSRPHEALFPVPGSVSVRVRLGRSRSPKMVRPSQN